MAEARKDNPSPAPDSAKARSTAPIDWRRLHLWQIQPLRDGLMIAGVFGLVYLGNVLRIVTVPMLLAMLMAYLFEPVIRRVTVTKHVSRQGAALGIIILAGVLILVPLVVGGVVGVVQGATVAGNIAQNTGDLIKAVDPQTPDDERRAANQRLDQGFWRWSSENISRLRRDIIEYQAHKKAVRGEASSAPADPAKVEAAPAPNPAGAATPPTEKPAGAPPDVASPDQVLPVPPAAESAEPSATPDQPAISRAPLPEMPAWKEQLYRVIDSTLQWIRGNSQELAQTLGKQAAQILGSVLGILQSLGFVLFGAFLTAFFFFFFSTGWGRVLEFWESLIPERRKHRVIELVQKMDLVIAGFIRGRLTICILLGFYMTIAYWIIGVPSAFLLGPIIGMLFIVPFVHVIGVPIAIVLLSLEPSAIEWQNTWWWIVFAPIVVYMGAQFLDDYILSPAIQGKNTNMDTPTILFASLAGGTLAGVYGLLIAIPVAACIKILFMEVFLPRIREWAEGKKPDILPIES